MQKIGAALVVGMHGAERDDEERQRCEQADNAIHRDRPVQPRHALGKAGEAGGLGRRPQSARRIRR